MTRARRAPALMTPDTMEKKTTYWSLAAIYLITFGIMAQTYADPILWPLWGQKIGLADDYTVVIAFSALFSGVFTPIAAKCCARGDKKAIFLAAAVVFALAGAGQAFCPSLWPLLGLRMVLGAAATFANTAGILLIGDIFPPERRGFWLGVNGVFLGGASLVAPPLVGIVWEQGFGAAVFGFSCPFIALGAALGIKVMPAFPGRERSGGFDPVGAFLIAVCVASFLLLSSFGGDWREERPAVFFGLIILCVAAAVAAIFSQKRAGDDGVLPPRLFRERNFNVIMAAAVLAAASATFFYYGLSYFMLTEMKATATEAGIAVALQFAVTMALGPAFGRRLAAAKGFSRATIGTGGLMVAVNLYFIFGLTAATVGGVCVAMVVFGAYAMMITIAYPLAAQNFVREENRPYAVGLSHLAATFGYCVMLAVNNLCLDHVAESVAAYRLICFLSLLLTVATVVATVAIRRKEGSHDQGK